MMMTKIDDPNATKKRVNKNRSDKTNTNKGESRKAGEFAKQKQSPKKNSAHVHGVKKKPLEPIHKIEWPEHNCEKCGKPIVDLTQALSDKSTGKPVHFECILAFLRESEVLKEKEEIVYIGHGNFAVVYFENPKIRSKFQIIKLIEWEDRTKPYQWRDEVAELGSST